MNADTGEPLDTLNPESEKWVKSLGSKAKTVSEVLSTKDPLVSGRTNLYILISPSQ